MSQPMPKNLKHITASISYCRHTTVKIAVGTQFHNCPFGNLFRSEHPIFTLTLQQLVETFPYAKTETERYLHLVATLRALGCINTDHCALALESVQFLEQVHKVLMPLVAEYILTKHKPKLPCYSVDKYNCDNQKQLKEFIKRVIAELETSVIGLRTSLTDKEATQWKLNEEIALERALTKILNSKKRTAIRYSERLGNWCMKFLQREEHVTNKQLAIVGRILQSKVDRVRDINSDQAREAIKVLKDFAPYEVNREQCLLCIRHAEAVLEAILGYSASFGFILLEDEKSKGNAKAQAPNYDTKTLVVNGSVDRSVSIKDKIAAMKAKIAAS